MEKVGNTISNARQKVTALILIARWIWVVNSVVAITSIIYHRYDITALAAFTWVLSLLAAAFGQRAEKYLGTVEYAVRQSQI